VSSDWNLAQMITYGLTGPVTGLFASPRTQAQASLARQGFQVHMDWQSRQNASLAVLHRGGLLTGVWVPDAAHEAMRDLIRTRFAAVKAVRTARQQLSAFLQGESHLEFR
jgi:transposase